MIIENTSSTVLYYKVCLICKLDLKQSLKAKHLPLSVTVVTSVISEKNNQLTAEKLNLTALNSQLSARNQELETQKNNLTEQIQNMASQRNELNIARVQWSINAYCPRKDNGMFRTH